MPASTDRLFDLRDGLPSQHLGVPNDVTLTRPVDVGDPTVECADKLAQCPNRAARCECAALWFITHLMRFQALFASVVPPGARTA